MNGMKEGGWGTTTVDDPLPLGKYKNAAAAAPRPKS